MEKEQFKFNSVNNLADILNKCCDAYQAQERAKLKLEYFKVMGCFDGFDSLYE